MFMKINIYIIMIKIDLFYSMNPVKEISLLAEELLSENYN